jgi:predicted TIM-barrel fold metal-dependent hydrolase
LTAPIASPDPSPEPVLHQPPPGACDCHAHIFGPSDRFPYTDGRGYTPADAPVEAYLALLDTLGLARGVVVQGNAHGTDNRAILHALSQAPQRLRGIAITDARTTEAELRAWDAIGVRGLRFHLFHPDHKPNYRRGVGLDVFEHFRPVMRALGWHMQVWCDWRILPDMAPVLAAIGAEIPVVIDHMAEFDASLGVADPRFAALERLVGEGRCWAKVSGAYRCSRRYPDYADVVPMHHALIRANPERLLWGTDWPHPSMPAETMPNDGRLLNLLQSWTPDASVLRRILVENPARLYGFPSN